MKVKNSRVFIKRGENTAGSERRRLLIKKASAVILAFCFLLSLNQIISLWGEGYGFYGVGLFGYNIWAVGLYVIAVWAVYRLFQRKEKRLHVVSGCLGFLLSLGIVYGSYVHFTNDIFSSAKVTFLQVTLVFGFFAVMTALFEELLLLWDRLPGWYERKEKERAETGEEAAGKAGKNGLYFMAVWLFIFLSYIPIFLSCWPGNFVYDTPFQLAEVVSGSYKTHHPLLHTLFLGWAYKLGQSMGDVSAGCQLYTLIQMAILSSAFACIWLYFYKKRMPKGFRVFVLLWFAWFPMHAVFAVSCTKDVLFAAFFLYFTVFLVRLVFDGEAFAWYSYGGMVASGVLSVLMRNNALYAILAGGVVILLLERRGKEQGKKRLCMLAVLGGIWLCSGLANAGLAAAVQAENTDSCRESLSMPLQCLARVAQYRREDLSDDLYAEICMYIPEEDLVKYNPYLSDEIKEHANEELLRENFPNFLKLWLKVGAQFADEYVESIVANTMGYWYPLNEGTYISKPLEYYHKLIWVSDEIEKRDYCPPATKIYGPLFWQEEYREVPVLGYLFRLDGWVWLFYTYLGWCIYKKNKKAGALGAIPFFYLGTCYLGPVSILRYIYCLIVAVPLLFYMVMRSDRNKG